VSSRLPPASFEKYILTETSSHRIIGEEIIDETDRYQDNQSKKAAKRQGTAAVMRELFRLFRSPGSKTRADHHFPLSLGGIIERHKNVSLEAVVARQSVNLTHLVDTDCSYCLAYSIADSDGGSSDRD
jgi:hypothetical protein